MAKKHIVSLEGDWYGWKDRSSIRGMLEALEQVTGSEYQLRPCHSRDQLRDELAQVARHPSYKFVDISLHGARGVLKVGSAERQERVTLEELAEIMEVGFSGRVIHLGGCSTLRCSRARIERFLEMTGVRLLAGYTKDVDWVEAAAFQFMLLGKWPYFDTVGRFRNAVMKMAPELAGRLGLVVYP